MNAILLTAKATSACLVTFPLYFIFFRRVINNLSSKKLGYTVTQLVEALRYKNEGRGFDYR